VTLKGARLIARMISIISAAGCGGSEQAREEAPPSREVSAEPLLTIGEMDGDPHYLFGRIADAEFFPDGRIAVADFGARSVRIFDAAGTFVADLGREGEGPGEFRSVDAVWIDAPDTVAAFDSRLRRVTRFLSDGTVIDTRRLSTPLGSPFPLGVFGNGDIAAAWIRNIFERDETRVIPDTMEFARFGPGGDIVAHLGDGPGFRRFDGWTDPISPGPNAAVWRDSLYYTDGLTEISVRDRDGLIARRIPLPALEQTSAEIWAAIDRAVEERADPERSEVLRTVPRHDSIPRISRMLIDDAGWIWVKRFEPRDADVLTHHLWWNGGEWLVLDQRGRVTAAVRMPDELMPLRVQGGRILGFFRDEFNVERILVYEVAR